MLRRLVVDLPSLTVMRTQEPNVSRGGLFLPWFEPPPEAFAAIEVLLASPAGPAGPFPAKVVHLAPGSGVALSFDEPFAVRDAWRALAGSFPFGRSDPSPLVARWDAPPAPVLDELDLGSPELDLGAPPPGARPAQLGPELDLGALDDLDVGEVEVTGAGEPGLAEQLEPALADEPDEGAATLYDRIRAMSAPEKMQLAIHGDRSARLLLLKDTNKVIHTFIVQNKKITIDEVRYIAGYRQANPDALKLISESREWMQSPAVVTALVGNPKTPQAIALKLLDKVAVSELRRLAKSDGVPRAVQLAARRKLTG